MANVQIKKGACGTCGQYFGSYSSLYRHRLRHHEKHLVKSEPSISQNDVNPVSAEVEDPATTRKHPKCRICNEYFMRKLRCRPETVEVCDLCTKSLIEVGALQSENAEKRYVCETCQKLFSLKGNLDKHIRIHKNERPFACDECERAFNSRKCLDSHKLIHSGKKPFSCALCNKQFTQKSTLRSHFLIHVEEVAKGTKIKKEK